LGVWGVVLVVWVCVCVGVGGVVLCRCACVCVCDLLIFFSPSGQQVREQKRSESRSAALGGSLRAATTTSTIKRPCAVARSVFVLVVCSAVVCYAVVCVCV